jgi:hypothetical protein
MHVGAQTRYNAIRNAFGDCYKRHKYVEIRNDPIQNFAHALWIDTTKRWTPWLRSTVGIRPGYVHGSVNSAQNPMLAPGRYTGLAVLVCNDQ